MHSDVIDLSTYCQHCKDQQGGGLVHGGLASAAAESVELQWPGL